MPNLREILLSLQHDYFVNREEIINMFIKLIQTPEPLRPFRVFVIFGPGGIGKTVLLEELRGICADYEAATSLVSMEMCQSPIDVLTASRGAWKPTSAVKAFNEFDILIARFRSLRRKLQQVEETGGVISDTLGKVIGHVSSAAMNNAVSGLSLGPAGVLLGAASGKLASVVMESVIATLMKNGHLSRDDADFLSNVLSKLVVAYGRGLDRFANKKRSIVLMFDSYEYAEKLERLNNWMTNNLLPMLSEKVFVIIAGRDRQKGKFWQNYSAVTIQHRLEPFDKSDLKKYLRVRRLDISQSDGLYNFTGGLPLGAALWADIETQKGLGSSVFKSEPSSAEVVKAVVERLLENIEDPPRKVIRTCAIPRQFNEEILEYLLPGDIHPDTFDRLCKFSSIFSIRSKGLSMNDEVRKWLLKDLGYINPSIYIDLNHKMARYYAEKSLSLPRYSGEWFGNQVERLYHLLAAGDREGYALLQDLANNASSMYDIGLLESLQGVISQTPDVLGLWRDLLVGIIQFVNGDYVRTIETMQTIADKQVPLNTRADALSYLCASAWHINNFQIAISTGEQALTIYRQLEDQIGHYQICEKLGWVYMHIGKHGEAMRLQKEGLDITKKIQGKVGEGWALNGLGWAYLLSGLIGAAENAFNESLTIWKEMGHIRGEFYALFHLGVCHAESGRYESAIKYYEDALSLWPGSDDEGFVLARLGHAVCKQRLFMASIKILKKAKRCCEERQQPCFEAVLFLGEAYFLQNKLEESSKYYTQALDLSRRIHFVYGEAKARVGLLRISYLQGASEIVFQEVANLSGIVAQENQYHDLLAEIHLYKGLELLREFSNGDRACNDCIQEGIEELLRAFIESLQYNIYIFDNILCTMIAQLTSFADNKFALNIRERLLDSWKSSELNSKLVVEIENELRQRDELPKASTSLINRLVSGL